MGQGHERPPLDATGKLSSAHGEKRRLGVGGFGPPGENEEK